MQALSKIIKATLPPALYPKLRVLRSKLYLLVDMFQPYLTSRNYLGQRLFYIKGNGLVERIRFGSTTRKYEPHVSDAVIETINELKSAKKNICIFDIGANIGLVSLPLSNEDNVRIHAFEPGIRQFAMLQTNIAANNVFNKMHAYPIAFSNKRDTITFHSSTEETGGGSGDGILATSRVGETYTYKVESDTIDSWCLRYKEIPDIIKIDTEGAEALILDGAQEIINKYHPVLFIEIAPLNLSAYDLTAIDMLDKLTSLDYTLTTISGKICTRENISEFCEQDDMFIAQYKK